MFVCKKYSLARQSLMANLLSLNYLYIIDVHLLLWGDESLTVDQNIKIFKSSTKFYTRVWKIQIIINNSKLELVTLIINHVYAYFAFFLKRRLYEISHNEC